MPYTPPSLHRSPANSAPASPDVSRRPSFQTGPRPSLPRSSSYLTKNRRTPSAVGGGHDLTKEPTPPGTSEDLKGMATNGSVSVRQSPPPITDVRGMPNGAVISPPDSTTGSEEEDNGSRGRQIENLEELKDAISQIPVQRASSPTPKTAAGDLNLPADPSVLRTSFSTSALELSVSSRRRGHTRSVTEPKAMLSKSAETSVTASEEDSEEDLLQKPPMVRKKSGELVRPALRPPSQRRPSSMPGTPTFSKAVHFDSHLEHVRHFLQVDRPLAVSAGSSPVDNYDSDTEFPFPGEERSGTRSPPYEWEIVTQNHAMDSPLRRAQPVRLEKVWLSTDQKSLIGSAVVANLAFHKNVVCRFTLDYWKTTSEVTAEYSHELRSRETPAGYDRFTFVIKLSDLAHLESKTLYFCIRYNVNGQEFWDNNNGTNFQVDFRKKHLPQNGKRGMPGAASRPVGGLPRSNRRSNPSATSRPKSMPVGFDDFGGDKSKYNFDQPIHEFLGESGPITGLRLKTKSANNLASDNLSASLASPSGQAFSNRYDFGASLSAAVQAAKDSMPKEAKPDGLYMKSHRKMDSAPVIQKPSLPVTVSDPTPMASASVPGTSSPALASSSYEELVNKYCFFGSKQSSPQLEEGTLKSGARFDGAGDGFATRGTNSSSSSSHSSPRMPHHAGPAQHHSLPMYHHNSAYTTDMGAGGVSAGGSPLRTFISADQPGSSASSAPSAGGLPHYAGTSPDFPYAQHLHERFPFNNEAHAATAIRG